MKTKELTALALMLNKLAQYRPQWLSVETVRALIKAELRIRKEGK